jgi:hypothetical protein
MTNASRFVSQHHARLQPDGSITMFDNGGPPKPGREARALWLNVDETHRKVSVRRAYRYPQVLRSLSQGSVQVLPGGDIFVGWGGDDPRFSEFSPGGHMIFDAHFYPKGDDTYRAYRFPWSARPASPPDVAARVAGGKTEVYASWNGATDVAKWEVRAGSNPNVLLLAKTASKSGFETHITLNDTQQNVAVRALDSHGGVLGTSKTVHPSG